MQKIIYYYSLKGQLSITCSNSTEVANGMQLLVAVDHSQLLQ